jgi:hypothetical protein
MHSSKALKFAMALVLGTVFVAIPAAAEQYQIVRADYGHGNRRVDVTQRLRDIARSNVRFRMGNSTFGIDPAPGKVKTLRIYARGRNGKQRVFEYREGSTVDGSLFSGWGGGNWSVGPGDSGQYVIVHAEYGTARNHIDVTDRLRQLARSDRLFRMGNSTFGVDPDPGRVKTLRIYTRGPDGPRMFEYREGSTVDGSMFQGWGGGDWGRGNWRGGWNGDDDRHDDH